MMSSSYMSQRSELRKIGAQLSLSCKQIGTTSDLLARLQAYPMDEQLLRETEIEKAVSSLMLKFLLEDKGGELFKRCQALIKKWTPMSCSSSSTSTRAMNIKLEEPPADGEIKPRPPLSPPIQGGRPKLEVLELEEVVVERKLSLPLSLAFGKDPNNNGGSGGAGASANTNHNCLPSATAVRAAPIINHQRRHTEPTDHAKIMRMRANAQNAAKLKRRYSGEWHRGRRGREHRNRQQVGERRERAVSTVHRNVKILPNRFIDGMDGQVFDDNDNRRLNKYSTNDHQMRPDDERYKHSAPQGPRKWY